MASIDLVGEFRKQFSPEDGSLALRALSGDELVWNALQTPDIFDQISRKAGGSVAAWTPGALAMIATGSGLTPEALKQTPLMGLESEARKKALKAYEETRRTQNRPATLAEAGWVALALRERRRLTGRWNGLLEEILPDLDAEEHKTQIWQAALACLWGIIPDPEGLLTHLVSERPGDAGIASLALHVVFSQPESADVCGALLGKAAALIEPEAQLTLLEVARRAGVGQAATVAAQTMLSGHPVFSGLRTRFSADGLTAAEIRQQAVVLQQAGKMHAAAGNPAQAEPYLKAAEQAFEYLVMETRLELAGQTAHPGQTLAHHLDEMLSARYARLHREVGLLALAQPEEFCGDLPYHGADVVLGLASALCKQTNQEPAGKEAVRYAATAVLDALEDGDDTLMAVLRSDRAHPADLVLKVLSVGLPEEARSLGDLLLAKRAADAALNSAVGECAAKSGDLEGGMAYARKAVLLAPQQAEFGRKLAGYYEVLGLWNQAFIERQQTLVTMGENASLDDISATATAALKSGRADVAARYLETCVDDTCSNSKLIGLLGQAYLATGKAQAARDYLQKATQLNPDDAGTWLAYAQLLEGAGETDKALETLRSAAQAAPDSIEAHLGLGRACLRAGLNTEALPALQKATALAPESADVTLDLGKTLRYLGRLEEARRAFSQAWDRGLATPEMGYEYGMTLIELEEYRQAIPVLELATKTDEPVLEWNLAYARLLLGELNDFSGAWCDVVEPAQRRRALQALNVVLELDGENIEARYLLGQALRLEGRALEAVDLLSALLEDESVRSSAWAWRVRWGVALASLAIGETETAIAALREVLAERPQELMATWDLARALAAAELFEEARQAADDALTLDAAGLANLIRYADFISMIGDDYAAIRTLQQAVEIDASRPDLWISLAERQVCTGQVDEATSSYSRAFDVASGETAQLRTIAYGFMRLGVSDLALAALKTAAADPALKDATIFYDLAELFAQTGSPVEAIQALEQAMDLMPDHPRYAVFHADLLEQMGRDQDALASLQQALQAAESQFAMTGQIALVDGTADLLAGDAEKLLGSIHYRMGKILERLGSPLAALNHAEKALEYQPHQLDYRYHAAILAYGMLHYERARRLCMAAGDTEGGDLLITTANQGDAQALALTALRVEIALDANDVADAAELLGRVSPARGDTPRLWAARARIAARQNDLASAGEAYQLARAIVVDQTAPEDGLWLAQAAQECYEWEDGLAFGRQLKEAAPEQARANLVFLMGLARALEARKTGAVLKLRKHGAAEIEFGEREYAAFIDACEAAKKVNQSGEVDRWRARGELVFHPSEEGIKQFALLAPGAEETAALMSALRLMDHPAQALQMARQFPDDLRILFQTGLAMFANGQTAEAEFIFKELAGRAPLHPMVQAALALGQETSGALQGALTALETALSIWPEEAEWHAWAAELCAAVGDTRCNVTHRSAALAQDPGNASYALALGEALVLDGQAERALEMLQTAAELAPDRPTLWLSLARAKRAANQFEAAYADAHQAVALAPNDEEGYLLSGQIAEALNRTEAALQDGLAGLNINPANPALLLFVSRIYRKRGNTLEAQKLLERGLTEQPDCMTLKMELLQLRYALEGAESVLKSVKSLSEEHANDPEVLNFLANVQYEAGEVSQAKETALQALRYQPHNAALNLMVGKIQMINGQLDQAVYHLSESLRLNPAQVDAALELGTAYHARREHIKALTTYQQVIKVRPDDPRPYYQAALIMKEVKDYAGAEGMLRRAAKLAPEDVNVRRHLTAVIALNLVHSSQEASTVL